MLKLTADIPYQARHWRNDPAISKWCRQHTLISEDDQEKWVDKINSDPTIKMYGIEDTVGSVGVCGFTSINLIHRNAEISIYIAPEFEGKSYGIVALDQLISIGFNDWGFKRIWGEVFDGNPILSLYDSLEFKKEGTLRSTYWNGGKFIDTHIVSILEHEWIS